MKFDHMTLGEAGKALYRTDWVEPLALALDLNLRTVQRWATGKNEIPPWLWGRLAALCLEHSAELEQLAAKLRGGVASTHTQDEL